MIIIITLCTVVRLRLLINNARAATAAIISVPLNATSFLLTRAGIQRIEILIIRPILAVTEPTALPTAISF